jgi:transketolase C-terminal domain/subunit
MIGVAAGLAMSGKNVCVYYAAPFATMRCFEQIRCDVCFQNLPVKKLNDTNKQACTNHIHPPFINKKTVLLHTQKIYK